LKSSKIILSKSIFYVKNQQIKKKEEIIENFEGAALPQFTKYNIFLDAHSFF
jgi:hypothetical protein